MVMCVLWVCLHMHSLLWLCLTREALVVCVLKLCYHVGRVLASIVQHAQAVLCIRLNNQVQLSCKWQRLLNPSLI
jgi:hypothetical protein